MRRTVLLLLVVIPGPVLGGTVSAEPIVIASKNFPESYLLAEMQAQLLEDRGLEVERTFGLGGTMVCFRALGNGEIDIYPEYSGTILQAILKLDGDPGFEAIRDLVHREHGLELLDSFGFNNTYALAVPRQIAEQKNLTTVSDLVDHPDIRFGFSHEFVNREDGWLALRAMYGFEGQPLGIEHGLSYPALEEGTIDVIDAYSTDAEIDRYDLVLLDDDRGVFPAYLGAPLLGRDIDPRIAPILSELAGRIDAGAMRRLNSEVSIAGRSFADVAAEFLQAEGLLHRATTDRSGDRWSVLAARTATHIRLTAIAVLAGILIAVPFGVLIYRIPILSRPVLYLAGLLQTIPSIALLAFMIPLFGIGARPAIVALFLYALLPILRNTHAALASIDPVLKKVAVGIGLSAPQRLRHIEIPLAMPTILAGVRTATVINIGTATLAAFIGAGGLGEPIVTGLALNDTGLILEGAIPAAVLALAAELGFEAIERLVMPRHLITSPHR